MQRAATPNWEPKTIWTGDNLPIMRGMNSGCVDLIYLDPPFNSNANYAAPIGSKAAGAEFKDTWTLSDIDVEWINLIEEKHPHLHRILLSAMSDNDKSYLVYMAVRLLEMRRILKPAGCIYLHCDTTMSHWLKITMDGIFGRNKFRNEVVWLYEGRQLSRKKYNKKHDCLLFYAKDKEPTFNWRAVADPLKETSKKAMHRFTDETGRPYLLRYKQGGGFAPKEMEGQDEVYRQYPDEVIPPKDWVFFDYARKKERTGYPTQKPLALLEWLIKASSNEGDMVLDPFCGCATTLAAADKLGRNWVGIDISKKAAERIVHRIEDQQGLWRRIIPRRDMPQRTDLGALPEPASHKAALYQLQEKLCAGCKIEFPIGNLTMDHIIAKSKGGTDHKDNLQLLCGQCNSIKGDRGMDYLQAKLKLEKQKTGGYA